MIKHIYCLFDKEFGVYGQPLFSPLGKEEFLQQFVNDVRNAPEVPAAVAASDVYQIGDFDTNRGVIMPFASIDFLCHISDYVRFDKNGKEEN